MTGRTTAFSLSSKASRSSVGLTGSLIKWIPVSQRQSGRGLKPNTHLYHNRLRRLRMCGRTPRRFHASSWRGV